MKKDIQESSDPDGVKLDCYSPREGLLLVHRQETVDHFLRTTITPEEHSFLTEA